MGLPRPPPSERPIVKQLGVESDGRVTGFAYWTPAADAPATLLALEAKSRSEDGSARPPILLYPLSHATASCPDPLTGARRKGLGELRAA